MRRTGEELVRVEAVGICGADMDACHRHDRRLPAPLILGQGAVGLIVGGARDGTRVTVNPLVPCGICSVCQAGRENTCPDPQLLSLPPRLGLEALTPGNRRTALMPGGGVIGVAAVLALAAQGLEDVTVIESNVQRRDYPDAQVDIKLHTAVEGDDGAVIDAVGCDATRAASSAAVEPGGVILHIGLGAGDCGLDVRRFTLQEVSFIGTCCYTPQDLRDTPSAFFDGRPDALDGLEERALSQGTEAFADLGGGRIAAPKIVPYPWAV